MSSASILSNVLREKPSADPLQLRGEFGIGINPFARWYADLSDMRKNHNSPFLSSGDPTFRALKNIMPKDAAQHIMGIGLQVQLLPGTPVTIDNPYLLREEYRSVKDDPSARSSLPIFELVPPEIKRIYEAGQYNDYPLSKEDWDAMPQEEAKRFKGWNGYNFHVDSVAIDTNGQVTITLKLKPNKLLDAEVAARNEGLSATEYSARQFHSSAICICEDTYGRKCLVVQAKNVWANNGGDITKIGSTSGEEKLRLYHPALVAGGVEPKKFLASEDQKMVANPALFAAHDQASHEIGLNLESNKFGYEVSEPVAMLHEGTIGETPKNKLPRSLYCNVQHVMRRTDGRVISSSEIIELQKAYANEVYLPSADKGRGPEVRGCAFVPLEGADFIVIQGEDAKGNTKSYLCVLGVETVAISPEGKLVMQRADIILDSAYTGFLKHLLVEGDELRNLIIEKAGFRT